MTLEQKRELVEMKVMQQQQQQQQQQHQKQQQHARKLPFLS